MPETDFYRDVSPISPQEVAHNRQGSGSCSSSTKSQPDEQFTPKSATQFGGVLHVAPGVWKSAYIVSDRGVEFSPAHEFRLLQHFGPQEIKATRPLYEQEMSRKIRDAAMAVGPLYKDGDWVETAHYIGKVGGMDIAVSCNHQILQRQWRIGDAVKIDFGGLFVLDEGPPCSAASAVVIQVEETLDMLVMAITSWSGSCPTPLEPQYFYNLVAEEPVYVIGFNGTPAQENLDEFGKYQLSVFQEAVTKEEARRCLKSGLRMVSPGVAQSVDDLSKMSFKMSASVWYGSSGSPVLAVHGNAVVNIGRVVHGDGANSNVVFKYHQAHKDAIDVAVARVKNWPLLFASSIGTIVPNLC